MTLAWDPPVDSGGLPVLGYKAPRALTAFTSALCVSVFWGTRKGVRVEVAVCMGRRCFGRRFNGAHQANLG